MVNMNREEWLNQMLKKLYPHFKDAGYNIPENIRASVGFPSKGIKSKAIGECWPMECSVDNYYEIFIHPNQDDSVKVSGILVHEIVHTIVEPGSKAHGPEFKEIALKVGLCGKMKATEETPELVGKLENLIKEIGPYPHGKLSFETTTTEKKTDGPMKVICEDDECGYNVRIGKKWVEKGFPTCPCGKDMKQEVKE